MSLNPKSQIIEGRESDDQVPYNLTLKGSDDQSPDNSHAVK